MGSRLISASVQRVVGHRLTSTKSANVSEPATLNPLRFGVVICRGEGSLRFQDAILTSLLSCISGH